MVVIVLQQFDEWEIRKKGKKTHLSWTVAEPMCACDACEGGCKATGGCVEVEAM